MAIRNNINPYGLSRRIPTEVKRQVRADCGYGCVICGEAIVQYDHLDPEFPDAKHHDRSGIVLLCPTHHAAKTTGLLSTDTIRQARIKPKAIEQGFANGVFDLRSPFALYVGDNVFHDVCCIIRKRGTGDEWFAIEAPEVVGGPPRLSVKFHEPNGEIALSIRQNEWECSTRVWDFVVEGRQLTVRRARRDIMLQLLANPPHGMMIKRLRMPFWDSCIEVTNRGNLQLIVDGTNLDMIGSSCNAADAVFSIP